MVEKLSVQIALEGGAEIERQLADIGKAGQEAFAEIEAAATKAGGFKELDPKDVTQKLQNMGVTGAESISKIQKAVQTAGRFENLVQGVQSVEGAFMALGRAVPLVGTALGVLAGAFLKFGKDAADTINQVNASAAKLGLSFQQFDKLSAGLEQAGISSGAIADGLQHLKKQGLDAAKALPQIIAQLQAMPDGVNRTNTAIALLGDKLGVELVAALRTGSLSLAQFNAATGTFTEAQRNAAARYQQTVNQLSAEWNRFIADVVLPVAIPLFDALKAGLEGVRQGIATTKREWDALVSGLSAITPSVGIDISLTGSLQSQLDAAKAKLDAIGQAGAQAGQQGEVAFTAWGEAIKTTGGQAEQTGQQAGQAGQAGAQGAQQATTMWTQWGTAATQAGAAAEAAGQKGATAGQTIAQGGQQATSIWDALLQKIKEVIEASAGARVTGGEAGAIPGVARGGLLGGRGSGTSDSNLAWVSRGEHIMPARVVRQPGVLSLLEALRRGGGIPGFAEGGTVGGGQLRGIFGQLKGAVDAMNRIMAPLHDSLSQVMDKLNQSLRQVADGVSKGLAGAMDSANQGIGQIESSLGTAMNGVAQTIVSAMESLSALIQQIEQEAKGAKGKARGGLLGGRGTGTSDSNLAWVSRGEYIMPARAVRQPDILAFLEALRRSGGNLSRVLDGMGRFALGGMVPRLMPAFASGGLAGGNNVTIQFPGLPAIGGLRASSEVVDELRKAAALAQVRSGGRKPSRYS